MIFRGEVVYTLTDGAVYKLNVFGSGKWGIAAHCRHTDADVINFSLSLAVCSAALFICRLRFCLSQQRTERSWAGCSVRWLGSSFRSRRKMEREITIGTIMFVCLVVGAEDMGFKGCCERLIPLV